MITTLSATLSQQIVNTIKEVCQHDINMINEHGVIIASTNPVRIGTYHEIGKLAALKKETIEVSESDNFTGTRYGINSPLFYDDHLLCVVGITGRPEEVRQYATLAQRIANLLIREQELNILSRHLSDKKHFIIQTLIHNDHHDDALVLEYLNEFSIPLNTLKRIVIVHMQDNHYDEPKIESLLNGLYERENIVLHSLFWPNDFIAIIEDKALNTITNSLQTISKQCKDELHISIGKKTNLFKLNESYNSARIALTTNKPVAIFDDLTLEIVLSSLDDFARNKFIEKTIYNLNDKEVHLLQTYYATNMSLEKTSEQLFLHKNTLQYQLNHIYAKTNLNPRSFQDAVILYLALKLL